MHAWPDAPALREFLARAGRRLAVLAAARGATVGVLVATGGIGVAWLSHGGSRLTLAFAASGVFVLTGIAAGWWRATRAASRIAVEVEARAPECRHLVVTAAELLNEPARVSEYVGAVVCRDAVRIVIRLDVRDLFPGNRTFAALAGGVVLWIAMAVVAQAWPAPAFVNRESAASVSTFAAITTVEVTITPPAYAGQRPSVVRDPARVDAPAGSLIHVDVRANAATVDLETLTGRRALAREAPDRFSGDVVADADGFLAFQPSSADGSAGTRRFIGLVVQPDRPPIVRVVKPGRDLFVADPRRTLDVEIDATDDLALASLRLIYTKVTGSGENFEFNQGECPVQMSRKSAREWTGTGRWDLGALGLEPGDMVVYRAVAADARFGAPAIESDAFIVQIVAPGSVAAEGFAVDDLKDKYALSQRMVIVKTERLIARRASLSASAFADESANIAAEQRQVRAEFVFMLGGELGGEGGLGDLNEELEAAGEADLLAGRMQNRGRVDVLLAIRRMSEAVSALGVPNATAALKAEQAALVSLQSAFSKSRYLLRALSQRASLDFSRRLGGLLSDVARGTRTPPEAAVSPRVQDLRRVLAKVATLAGHHTFGREDAAEATTLAEGTLRVDPSAAPLQHIASQLAAAADAMARGRTPEVAGILDDVAIGLTQVIRAEVQDAPGAAPDARVSRLSGLLADALRSPKDRR